MQNPRLLIVEDNSPLCLSLSSQLRRSYRVDLAPTLQAAYALLTGHSYDVLLLDRMLPDGDGLEILPLITRNFPQTKICIMSSSCELSDRLLGVSQGADLYVAKPFHPQEVFLMIQALLRRGRLYHSSILRWQNLELHLDSNMLVRDSKQILLTNREAQLLELFLNSKDSYITREQIRNWLWENGLERESSRVHVYAQRLRRKLQHIRGTIVAHYGTGYELRLLDK